MATIRDMMKAAEEMERFRKQLLGPSESLTRALDRFQTVTDPFRHIHDHLKRQEGALAARLDLSALSRPAIDVSQVFASQLNKIETSIARFNQNCLEPGAFARLEAAATASLNATAGFEALSRNMTDGWLERLGKADAIHRSAFPLEAHISRLYELSAVAGASLARVSSDTLGTRLGLEPGDRSELVESHEALGDEYFALFAGLRTSELGVLEVPPELTELPAVEFVNQAALVVSTSEAEPDEEAEEAKKELAGTIALESSDRLTALVARINPELTHLLNGAREAYASRRADYVRHFVTSYRELFTHILHTIAPDEEIEKWSKDPTHYHNKRPTRRARLLFVTRDLQSTFGGFLGADVDAVLAFIEVFQRGTHGIRPSFSEEQLADMKTRTEGLILLLLTVYTVTAGAR